MTDCLRTFIMCAPICACAIMRGNYCTIRHSIISCHCAIKSNTYPSDKSRSFCHLLSLETFPNDNATLARRRSPAIVEICRVVPFSGSPRRVARRVGPTTGVLRASRRGCPVIAAVGTKRRSRGVVDAAGASQRGRPAARSRDRRPSKKRFPVPVVTRGRSPPATGHWPTRRRRAGRAGPTAVQCWAWWRQYSSAAT